jgi:DNA-binding NtrC family response regulator
LAVKEETLKLVADRFASVAHDHVIDLATGSRVTVSVRSVADDTSQARWAVRCDALQKAQHRSLAPLIDYGSLGAHERFETWACDGAWSGACFAAERAIANASRFLDGCGLTSGSLAIDRVRTLGGRAVLLPDEEAGYPLPDDRVDWEATSLDVCGLVAFERPTLTSAFESLRLSDDCRPRIVSIYGPPGCGKTATLLQIARHARLQGYVPVAARLLSRIVKDLDRHFCLLDDDSQGLAWQCLARMAVGSPKQHAVVIAADEELRLTHGLRLDRVQGEALVAAVRPLRRSTDLERTIQRAAAAARGMPGRFAASLGVTPSKPAAAAWKVARRGLFVAEEGVAYAAAEDAAMQATEAPPSGAVWPPRRDVRSLRRRMTTAIEVIEEGHFTRGVRELRQAIGALARRRDWTSAVAASVSLASALLSKGEPKDALAALNDAQQFLEHEDQVGQVLVVGTLCAEAWIDRGRLDEAESVISSVLVAGRPSRPDARMTAASLTLARCLFWQGRFAEAEAAIAAYGHVAVPSDLQIRAAALAARILVGRGDFVAAMTRALGAVELASRGGSPAAQARAHRAAAFVHLAVGDLPAAKQNVERAIVEARAARRRLDIVRARLLKVEADRRGGITPLPRYIKTLSRREARLPAVIRARLDLLRALGASDQPDETARRVIAASGLRALSLYAPEVADTRSDAVESFASEATRILEMCQDGVEEPRVLNDVCARLRRQLHGHAVAVFSTRQKGAAVAANGPSIPPVIADRAIASETGIAPHRHEDHLDAAAPVRYGGAVIGAVAARWTLASQHDLSRALAALGVAATAIAPILAALDRRRDEPTSRLGDLVGVSSAIDEVRRAVVRAAGAPFPVLVTGESGSGKELVARAIHRHGARRAGPFCSLNCAALPDELVEAELFGHARGAFTGAVGDRLGVFEAAHGGTLFLDEVSELSLRAQAKMLRAVQEAEVRRVGENVSRRVDARLVVATNRDLRQDAVTGRFRIDLLYRLDVIRIAIPPLRERREDIEVLADHFWRDAAKRVDSRAMLAAATIAALARYDWPGNVRELQNVLASLAVRAPRRGAVTPAALPIEISGAASNGSPKLDEARRAFEERFVREALVRAGGHRGRVASELGVTRQGLAKLMARLRIS